MSDHWWGMDLLEQRDADGNLTPLALALDAIQNNGCDCGTDEPGSCMACICEAALRDIWERLQAAEGRHAVECADHSLTLRKLEDASGVADEIDRIFDTGDPAQPPMGWRTEAERAELLLAVRWAHDTACEREDKR